jgi:hypothetical protein
MNAAVLFLKSNKHEGNILQQNKTDSAQGPYVELHNWDPYQNSEGCIPAKGSLRVKVFTVRNVCDFRRSEIFGGYFDKNFHGCPINVFVRVFPLLVYSTGPVDYNDSKHQHSYVSEWEVELIRVIGKALNMSMHIVHIVDGKVTESLKDIPLITVGAILAMDLTFN